jgi:hypothetical protein
VSAALTHLHTTPTGVQRPSITPVRNDFTRTPFPNIRFDLVPLPRVPVQLKPAHKSPVPTRSYVFPRPGDPWSPRPIKYYHNRDLIGRGNRHKPATWRKNCSGKPILRDENGRHRLTGTRSSTFQTSSRACLSPVGRVGSPLGTRLLVPGCARVTGSSASLAAHRASQ